jgi:dTDP-4-dehydrorhamnose reductase
MDGKMRLYITGGTGLVGSNVIRLARQQADIEIIASQFGPEPEWDVDYTLDPLDMGNLEAVKNAILTHQPDVVIHSAAILDMPFLYQNRALAWKLVVEATRTFAHACREIGARFIFVSSDWVFDGHEPLVDEDSPPHPVNFYGITKIACERELSSMDGLNYAIARLAGVYGLNYANPSLLRKDNGLGFTVGNFVTDRVSQGLIAPIWMGPKANDVAHPTLASDGAELLLRLAKHDAKGIFHCFGSEAVSRLQFAHDIADLFGANHALVAPVPTDPELLDAYRHIGIPFRIRASTEKTSAILGRKPLNVLEGLEAFKKEWDAFHA